MNIGKYTYEEFSRIIESFHGSLAPGVLVGGFMVNLALEKLPECEFYDAICETRSCLPDALQILTPCTIGNGWLKILDFGKFAVTLYDKTTGNGVRVFLDTEKLKQRPEIQTWFFKQKPKKEQNKALLLEQIVLAGYELYGMQKVLVEPEKLTRKKIGPSAICPVCGEAYPVKHGEKCRSCGGQSPYKMI